MDLICCRIASALFDCGEAIIVKAATTVKTEKILFMAGLDAKTSGFEGINSMKQAAAGRPFGHSYRAFIITYRSGESVGKMSDRQAP